MAFTEDLTAMFDVTYGFAVNATYKTRTIPVIFDEQYYAEQGIDVDIASSRPAATCKTSDVSTAAEGDSIVIDGTTYTVTTVMPDGTGITVLSLVK